MSLAHPPEQPFAQRPAGNGGSVEHAGSQRAAGHPQGPGMLARRAAMAGLTAFITVNIWTGAPLFALWVGSKTVGRGTLSMGAVGVVVVVLAVVEFVLAVALTWLNKIYDELIGRPRVERRSAWLRSMRAEAEGHISQRVGITLL